MEQLVECPTKEVRYKKGEMEHQGIFEQCVHQYYDRLDLCWAIRLRDTEGPWEDVFSVGSSCNRSVTIKLVDTLSD